MQHLEQRPEILNVWLAHGFPLGDVPTTGVKVVMVTDDNRVRGEEIAEQMGRRCSQPFTPDIFSDFGIDPTKKKILIVKSMQHFYAGFEPIPKAIYYAGDLGSTISDVMQICYQRLDTNRFWPFVNDPFME
jgi:microcystin degradation protein MlrC